MYVRQDGFDRKIVPGFDTNKITITTSFREASYSVQNYEFEHCGLARKYNGIFRKVKYCDKNG